MVPFLLILWLVAGPFVKGIDFTPIVKIDSGNLKGSIVELNNTDGAKVRQYLGIPYATAKRFERPEAPSKWSDTKEMTSFGKVCPQALNAFSAANRDVMSEDCLNLNVYVPNDVSSSSSLPVMVWIHGGGFVFGSNTNYDGSYLAVMGQVVVVVINYRLTVFGFLSNGKQGDIKGNYGMLDQVEALKWVQRNIKGFNGDPEKVTIFGESAGGASVSLLMLSKLARGLFKRGITQSDAAAAPWATQTIDIAFKRVRAFSKNIGCPEDLGKLKECLKPKDFMEIINASLYSPFPTWHPVIDGYFLEDSPSEMFKNQKNSNFDIMLGVTNDEGVIFANTITGYGVDLSNGLTRDAFIQALTFGERGLDLVIPEHNLKPFLINTTIFLYTNWTDVEGLDSNRRGYLDAIGDSGFIAPAIKAAQAYSKKKAATYFYFLEYGYDAPIFGMKHPLPSWVRAAHGDDTGFLFNPLLKNKWSDNEYFSRAMIRIWTNFAKTGNPTSPDDFGITWPQYTPDKQQYLSLKPDMAVGSHLRAKYVQYWNQVVPDALSSITKQPRLKPRSESQNIKNKDPKTSQNQHEEL